MKNLNLTFILFLSFISLAVNAQVNSGFGFFTDRDTYVSGETVLAKMYLPTGTLSRIVHLDLVNQSGKRISGASVEIKNSQADGYFQLPDSLSSGTYLLRAYLRNNADQCRMIRELWIANRFDKLEKVTGISKAANLKELSVKSSNEIRIANLEENVKTNSGIQTQVQLDEKLLEKLDGNLLISVSRFVPQFESSTFQLGTANANTGLTESSGIIYTGTVTDKKTSAPASKVTVYLTIPDSVPEFQYYITGNDGRFYFLIDHYYGDIQAIIQCYTNEPSQRLKIIQEEPYASVREMPGFTNLPVSEEFKNEMAKSIDAVTFQKIFGQVVLSKQTPPVKKSNSYSYYGVPSNRVDPQLFIDLPNFTEISRELLPGVKFRNHNNEPTLQVLNSQTRDYFKEQPLILIDGIPIRDLNMIKDMGSTDIDRVDICQSERFYGNLRFPGVVAIYTTNSDYSNLPENDQLIKLNTEAKQIPVQLAEPMASESSVPDLRQTLYWNASAEPGKIIPVKFGTSNVLGLYKMTVRGMTTDGTLIFTEKQFEVK